MRNIRLASAAVVLLMSPLNLGFCECVFGLGTGVGAGFSADDGPTGLPARDPLSVYIEPGTQQTPQEKPKDLYKAAMTAVSARQLGEALDKLERCVAIAPKHKDCNSLLKWVQAKRLEELRTQLANIDARDLLERRPILVELAKPELGDAPAVSELADLDREQHKVQDEASSYVSRLHASETFEPIPASLAQYVGHLPVLDNVVVEARTHQALANARQAAASGRLVDAMLMLNSVKERDEVAPVLASLKESFGAARELEISKVVAAENIEELERQFAALGEQASLLDPTRTRRFRQEVLDRASQLVKKSLANSTTPTSSAVARVVREKLRTLGAEPDFPWAARTETREVPLVGISFEVGQGCEGLPELPEMRDPLAQVLPVGMKPTARGGELVAELSNFRCNVQTVVDEPRPTSSNYVSGYQQVTNPDYVQLQTQLQAAQADLNRQTVENATLTGFAAVAGSISAGILQGRVNRLRNQLANTPPFYSQPVTMPYTVYHHRATKKATMTAELSLVDSATGFADVIPVSASAEVSDDGVSGVMAGDSSGLANREPSFAPDANFLEKAAEALRPEAAKALRVLGERSFVRRSTTLRGSKPDAREALRAPRDRDHLFQRIVITHSTPS
jgi:hypothetical protein